MTVREQIARILCKIDGYPFDALLAEATHFYSGKTKSDYYSRADQILDLQDEQGNKVLLERDPDQSLPLRMTGITDEVEVLLSQIEQNMLKAGFVKVKGSGK